MRYFHYSLTKEYLTRGGIAGELKFPAQIGSPRSSRGTLQGDRAFDAFYLEGAVGVGDFEGVACDRSFGDLQELVLSNGGHTFFLKRCPKDALLVNAPTIAVVHPCNG